MHPGGRTDAEEESEACWWSAAELTPGAAAAAAGLRALVGAKLCLARGHGRQDCKCTLTDSTAMPILETRMRRGEKRRESSVSLASHHFEAGTNAKLWQHGCSHPPVKQRCPRTAADLGKSLSDVPQPSMSHVTAQAWQQQICTRACSQVGCKQESANRVRKKSRKKTVKANGASTNMRVFSLPFP